MIGTLLQSLSLVLLVLVAPTVTAKKPSNNGQQSIAMIGTNVGGWQVLEPWITPSLFYRFLGKNQSEGVGMDPYTFCEALGPELGNQVMRAHWDAWITEEDVAGMAQRKVEVVRLPIGDWTLRPYGPYIGCMDGAAEKIDWFFTMATKYNLKVLLDVHCLKDSQNGFDNSGKANKVVWNNATNFDHWDYNAGEWMGKWNGSGYDSINYENIQWAFDNVELLLQKYGHHNSFYALEPVNEPWWNSDMTVLKDFYRKVRKLIQTQKPELKFVFHDAFQFSASVWNDLFDDNDTENVIMDTHFYTAWWDRNNDIGKYCDSYQGLAEAYNIKYDVWVGEWSLATDVCAMWLGGFNDNNTPYRFDCEWVPCPYSYLPSDLAVDFDRTAATLGPYGTPTPQTVQNGNCAKDSTYFGNDDMITLGHCAIYSMNDYVQGHFLWTYHNELEEKWSYKEAYDRGWIL